jgi:hypothetical protein
LTLVSEHFFIVGAQRSGTTYLYQLCVEHPEIEMAQPARPEPKFFLLDDLYARGLDYYHRQFFSDEPGSKLRGEKSTSYYESERAARRIARHFPSAKIVFLLRDPIDRAISNYHFSVQNGLETLPMAEAFLREDERQCDYDPGEVSVSPFAYLRRGRYIDYLTMYERYFPRESLGVFFYERLVAAGQPDEFFSFLGTTTGLDLPSQRRVINASPPDDTCLDPAVERYLRDCFAEPNARLAQYLDTPLTFWRSMD